MSQPLRMAAAAAALVCSSFAGAGTLTIESWRVDDKGLWEEVLLPAFYKANPGITVKFAPTAPPEYNSALNARLTAGTAGDLVTCRPFDVSLDLIFGVPGQTIEDWERTLEEAIAHSPEHLSTYGLTFEKGTSFWNRREAGGLVSLSDEVEREMYGMAMDVLPERGYGQYEISNFARTGKECRHNQTYWSGDEYFAHGPGAARYLQGVRATNHRSVTTWLARMERNESPIMEEERLEPEGQARELLFLGLRRNRGVDRSEYKERTGFDLDQLVGKTIRKHVSLGWIEEVGDGIRLTREGRFVADSVMSDYLA